MKFSTRELDKYLPMTTDYKLDHICVMLEKIVDGIGHPQVILAGDLIDQQLWTKEYARLREENANLREQLWREAKKEPPNKSGYYLTKQLGGIIDITYYYYTSTYGWECDNNVLKWMPIPEDGDA